MNGDEIAGHVVSDGREESACPPGLTSKPSPKSYLSLSEPAIAVIEWEDELLPRCLGTENGKK